MGNSSRIEFVRSKEPIKKATTKFGGQPNWVAEPQWPLSRETGNPMRFIAQIELAEPHFGGASGKMAYIFMTDDEEDYVDGTWEPDGGENAVVIQPGSFAGPTSNTATGPTLYAIEEEDAGEDGGDSEPLEFSVKLKITSEPDFTPEEARESWGDEEYDRYAQALEGNKIGGAPFFIQGDEFPNKGQWKLLLQLDSMTVPFFVNFGDAGVAYVFINSDGSEGKFLWQCA